VVDARLNLEDARLLARLSGEQRRRLRQAEQWNGQVFRLWSQGRSKEALPLAKKALQVRRQILGERHRLTALSWLNLGAQHAAVHQVEPARRCYRRALSIRKEALGERHPDYAISLNNLAMLYRALGEHRLALPLFQQALRLRREVLGEKHPSLHRLRSATAVDGSRFQVDIMGLLPSADDKRQPGCLYLLIALRDGWLLLFRRFGGLSRRPRVEPGGDARMAVHADARRARLHPLDPISALFADGRVFCLVVAYEGDRSRFQWFALELDNTLDAALFEARAANGQENRAQHDHARSFSHGWSPRFRIAFSPVGAKDLTA
jgi:hypothetical protein